MAKVCFSNILPFRVVLPISLLCLITGCVSEISTPPITDPYLDNLLEIGRGYHFSGRMVDYVVVDKSDQTMFLIVNKTKLKEYSVSLGGNPVGHKNQEGDQRTPEGWYILDYKKADSDYYKAIHISYPNKEDRAAAASAGLNPGGQIMIHGQKNGSDVPASIVQQFNWTAGCIAVTNVEMDEVWNLVEVGTPIVIQP